jgi:hypothetical protein
MSWNSGKCVEKDVYTLAHEEQPEFHIRQMDAKFKDQCQVFITAKGTMQTVTRATVGGSSHILFLSRISRYLTLFLANLIARSLLCRKRWQVVRPWNFFDDTAWYIVETC